MQCIHCMITIQYKIWQIIPHHYFVYLCKLTIIHCIIGPNTKDYVIVSRSLQIDHNGKNMSTYHAIVINLNLLCEWMYHCSRILLIPFSIHTLKINRRKKLLTYGLPDYNLMRSRFLLGWKIQCSTPIMESYPQHQK